MLALNVFQTRLDGNHKKGTPKCFVAFIFVRPCSQCVAYKRKDKKKEVFVWINGKTRNGLTLLSLRVAINVKRNSNENGATDAAIVVEEWGPNQREVEIGTQRDFYLLVSTLDSF